MQHRAGGMQAAYTLGPTVAAPLRKIGSGHRDTERVEDPPTCQKIRPFRSVLRAKKQAIKAREGHADADTAI
jgi:hypothetical protein